MSDDFLLTYASFNADSQPFIDCQVGSEIERRYPARIKDFQADFLHTIDDLRDITDFGNGLDFGDGFDFGDNLIFGEGGGDLS